MENTLSLFCPGSGTLNSEDALPVVEDLFLQVADGLGGSGGFSHGSLEEGAINKETFFDTVFKNVFNEKLTETEINKIRNYAEESLEKYFKLTTEEKRDRRCIYKSGYFASRIASTLMYGYITEIGKDGTTAIFEEFDKNSDRIAELEDKYSQVFTSKLSEGLVKAAENGHFVYESKVRGLILLPTTLVTILYEEHEDYVDTLYLWAGDSRGYRWDANGLVQVSEDHETDGVITNQINLDKKFYISCKYARVKKPCLIFCTSDGCYSCMTSPLDFEYYFFDQFRNASSLKEATELLRTLYMSCSEDDTNTVALKAFGFDSYEMIRKSIDERLKDLVDFYEKELPGIFTINFQLNCDNAKRSILKITKDLTYSDEKEIEELVYSHLTVKREAEEKRAELMAELENCHSALKDIVSANYWYIAESLRTNGKCIDYYNINELKNNILNMVNLTSSKERFLGSVECLEKEFELKSIALKELFARLKENYKDAASDDEINEYCGFLYDVADFLYDIIDGKNRDIRNCEKVKDKLEKSREKAVFRNSGYVEKIVSDILNKTLDTKLFEGIDCYEEILNVIAQIDKINSALADDGGMEDIRIAAEEYWKRNRFMILCELYEKNPGAEFWNKHETDLVDAIKDYIENKNCVGKRDMLYERYNIYYYGKKGVIADA